MTSISGSVEWFLLVKNEKYILIFSDIHSKSKYCTNNDSVFFNEWLNSIKNNSLVLIEEVDRTNVELKELWKEAVHTQKLKDWYIKNSNKKNVIPIDIRPFLLPFSWQLWKENDECAKYTLKKYIELIKIFLFQEINSENKKIISPLLLSIIHKLEKVRKNNKKNTGLMKHFNLIKKKFISFCAKHKDKMNLLIEKWVDQYDDWMGNYLFYNGELKLLTEIEEIISAIMEWYTILNIMINDKLSVIHAGLAHTRNIKYILENIYKFSISESFTHNLNKSTPDACVVLSPDINDKWTRKIGGFFL